ncbi:MAG: YfcC family protein [Carnobacterium sp.]|nr:YfcC family protein [Carnobacterium sp.]
MEKKKRLSLSSFSILFIILIALALVSVALAGQPFDPTLLTTPDAVAKVIPASISTIVMAPFNGFKDAIEICIFILMLGGYLSIVNKTGALEAGIQSVVKKLKGNELIIIPILMILFSIGGSTFGMAEETLPFYALLTSVMVAAGFDTIVSVGTVLLGSGAGVLGSTVNPFATGVAMDALKAINIDTNAGLVIGIGIALWIVTLLPFLYFVMSYAKKVKADKGSTILSLQEQENMNREFRKETSKDFSFTRKHKIVLILFGLSFLIMIISLIPWQNFGIMFFNNWTAFLTGNSFGEWYFGDLSMLFLIMGLIIAFVYRLKEKETISAFIAGASDMLSVVLIIVVARGTSVLMASTHLDLLILDRATNLLGGLSPVLFVVGSFIVYFFLAFLIPSSSGLAYVTMPIMGGLAYEMGIAPEIMIMIFASTHGVINLVSPTSGILMGGLEMNKIEYSTWIRFMRMPVLAILITNLAVLILSLFIL